MDRFTASALALLAGFGLIVVGLADVAGNATVSMIVGGVLVLASLIASVADRHRGRRPAC